MLIFLLIITVRYYLNIFVNSYIYIILSLYHVRIKRHIEIGRLGA